MFITRKFIFSKFIWHKITDTYNKGFHIGKLYGVTKIYNEIKGGNTDVIDLCKRIMSEKEVFNT